LQRLSGKERRFQAWVNHRISKAIVSRAKATNSAIALEDLTGIRERVNQQPRSKAERRRANSWAFYQLRQFLEYKALRAGVALILVPPAYTSQTCHRCLHIHPDPAQSYRSGKKFKCGHCGWEGDADLNGANVIALLGAAVNQPRGQAYGSLRERGWLANCRATESPPCTAKQSGSGSLLRCSSPDPGDLAIIQSRMDLPILAGDPRDPSNLGNWLG